MAVLLGEDRLIPSELERLLEESGQRLERRRILTRVDLPEGGQWIVPVEHVRIRPVDWNGMP